MVGGRNNGLPLSIKVGPIDYAIAQCPEDDALLALSGHWGEIEYSTQRIRLLQAMGEDHKKVTLFHELIHACLHNAGSSGSDEEEAFVAKLAPVLVDMLVRNPELTKFIEASR